ncbi:hypothetical protein GCM10010245_65700 [Streptomyces spectabilis]|nr:hypothetical protein GCM10010245_65700 [Streptomyces spectabilis]
MPDPAAVDGRKPAHVTEVAHTGKLGFGRRNLLRHGLSSGSGLVAARRTGRDRGTARLAAASVGGRWLRLRRYDTGS